VVSHPDVAGPEMLARNGYSRRRGLLHIFEDLLHFVTQQKIAGALGQGFAEVFRVHWCQTRIRFGVGRSLLLQERFEELLRCCHMG